MIGRIGTRRDARGQFALQLRKTEVPVQPSAGVYTGLIIKHQELQPSANSIDNVLANKSAAAWANQALSTNAPIASCGSYCPQCLNAPTRAAHARRAAWDDRHGSGPLPGTGLHLTGTRPRGRLRDSDRSSNMRCTPSRLGVQGDSSLLRQPVSDHLRTWSGCLPFCGRSSQGNGLQSRPSRLYS